MTKLEEIICISPNFPCTNGGFLAPYHLLQYLPHFFTQQLSVPTGLFNVLLCFSNGLEKSLKQSISQPWQTNKFGQNVLKIAKSRGKKSPDGVTSKGQDPRACPCNSLLHKRFCQQLLGPALFSTGKVQNPSKQKDPSHASQHMVFYMSSYQPITSWKFVN